MKGIEFFNASLVPDLFGPEQQVLHNWHRHVRKELNQSSYCNEIALHCLSEDVLPF